MFFSPMTWVTKTLHPSVVAPANFVKFLNPLWPHQWKSFDSPPLIYRQGVTPGFCCGRAVVSTLWMGSPNPEPHSPNPPPSSPSERRHRHSQCGCDSCAVLHGQLWHTTSCAWGTASMWTNLCVLMWLSRVFRLLLRNKAACKKNDNRKKQQHFNTRTFV